MKLINSEKKENPLMQRVQYTVELATDKMPSRKETKNFLVEQLKVKKETLVVKKIESNFGSRKVVVLAYSYKNEDEISKIEEKYILERNSEVVKAKEE